MSEERIFVVVKEQIPLKAFRNMKDAKIFAHQVRDSLIDGETSFLEPITIGEISLVGDVMAEVV
jgi:hypothetical protein